MSLFALNLPDRRMTALATRVALAGALAAALGAVAAQAAVQPQLMKLGLLLACATALLVLAVRMPPTVLPLALVVGLLGLGNLELGRVVPLPMLGGQEKWVLLVLVGVAALGAAADASACRRPAWPPTLLLGAVFLVVSAGSLFYAADRDLAGGAVIHQVVQMAALAAGFFWVRRDREAKGLVVALATVGGVSALLALWQFLGPDAFESTFAPYLAPNLSPLMSFWSHDLGRVGALWVFAPPLAAFLSALLPVFPYLLLQRRRGFPALAIATSCAMAVTALALTGTRMPLLGAAAGVGVLLALWGSGRVHGVRAGLIIVGVLVAGVVVASSLSAWRGSDANVLARLASLFGAEREVSASVTGRRDIYGTLLEAWRSEPWLGVGLGNTVPAIEEVTTFNSTPHAYWLGLLAETGVVGVGLVALMMAGMIPHYRRLLRRSAEWPERGFTAFALAASTALLVGGLFDNAMLMWQVGVLFWLLQGAVLSLSLRTADGLDGDGRDVEAEERSGMESLHAG